MSEKVNVAKTWEDAVLDNFEEQVVETTQEGTEIVTAGNELETPVADYSVEIVLPEGATIIEEESNKEIVEEQPQVVERVIEKYPEMNEDAKKLFAAFQSGNEEEVFNYLSEKRKDYSSMSDFDVVKESLIRSNPTWTERDIAIEIKSKYGSLSGKKDLSSIDEDIYPEEYQSAIEYNELIDERETILARDAREARRTLDEQKKNIEFPKFTQEAENQPTDEEIAEAMR